MAKIDFHGTAAVQIERASTQMSKMCLIIIIEIYGIQFTHKIILYPAFPSMFEIFCELGFDNHI